MQQIASQIEERKNQDWYEEFLFELRRTFINTVQRNVNLFTTSTPNLFGIFLSNLPEHSRQHYNCNACCKFVNTYGGLVTIDSKGVVDSAMWDELTVPEFFRSSVRTLRNAVERAKVTGVFYSSKETLGVPVTGQWHHMYVFHGSSNRHTEYHRSAYQKMAEKKQDFITINKNLSKYALRDIERAVTILSMDVLHRSEKFLGLAKWLLKMKTTKNKNIVWYEVAKAPAGFCNVGSSMIGTLLDDIRDGYDLDSAKKRFDSKMHPLKYQRPQTAPSVGNIEQAEKLIERMGLAPALERRFARLEELQLIWKPPAKEQKAVDGVFGHLKHGKKERQVFEATVQKITWAKFESLVLPKAESIEYFVPECNMNYGALLTAEDQDAPPIIQWDTYDERNPVSWYLYNNGSDYAQWNLRRGFVTVTGVCFNPAMWNQRQSYQHKGVFFILDGAKDSRYKTCGNGLFPEILRAELHGIRSTIEAHSKKSEIRGYDQASACGFYMSDKIIHPVIRVAIDEIYFKYEIDRMD